MKKAWIQVNNKEIILISNHPEVKHEDTTR